jgi:class 3 adenylate cyclase
MLEMMFAFGLLPLFLMDGAFVGLPLVLAHCLLLGMVSNVDRRLQIGYDFNIVAAFFVGLFICYWRERFIRSEFEQGVTLSGEKEELKTRLTSYVSLEALRRSHGEIVADAFGEVTILFSDIAGFTALSEKLAPRHLLELLARMFSEFDAIIEEAQVEKVKTIGDAYMVIAGTDKAQLDGARKIAEVALRMHDVVHALAHELGHALQLRSGIHIGSVIGGVIDQKKPIYDYWGRTVNTASRLEHGSEAGKIQISEAAYWRLRDEFACEWRGEMDFKGVGKVNCYYLLGRKHTSKE